MYRITYIEYGQSHEAVADSTDELLGLLDFIDDRRGFVVSVWDLLAQRRVRI